MFKSDYNYQDRYLCAVIGKKNFYHKEMMVDYVPRLISLHLNTAYQELVTKYSEVDKKYKSMMDIMK